MIQTAWLLLIYTVPSAPSRLRAAIWRDVKKAGAVYLRDGVCVLPARPETAELFRGIAGRVSDFGGRATLVEEARLDPLDARAIVDQTNATRADEYAEAGREADALLAHIQRERAHREFTFAEVEELEGDLGKLRRWVDQVRARDYFGSNAAAAVDEVLANGEVKLAVFLETARQHAERTES